MSNRFTQFDILKGIGIILVIAGHSLQPGLLYNFICSFHMPLFFLVSGYFFKMKDESFALKRYSQRLLWPYFLSCIILVILSTIINSIENQGVNFTFIFTWLQSILYGNAIINNLPLYSIGPLWFLPALFWGLLTLHTLLRIQRKCSPALSILLCVILSFYLAKKDIQLPLSILQGLMGSFFLYIGYLVKEHHPAIILVNRWSMIPMAIIWGIAIKSGFLSLAQCYASPELIVLSGAVFGTYFFYLLSNWLATKQNILQRSLVSIGSLTLLIICIHSIEYLCVPWRQYTEELNIGDNWSTACIFSVRFILVMSIVLILKRIQIVKTIFKI